MRTSLFSPVAFLFVIAAAAVSSPARAQSSDALAEALYNSALELMEAGKDAEACPKLEQSQEIDPAVGTLLYLGLCYERTGKTASAWAAYRAAGEASRKANQPERRDIALERAGKLEPHLSKLTLQMPSDAIVPGLEIRLDGAPVGTAAVGVPMPVDPGEHLLVVNAPGYQSSTQNIVVGGNADTKTVELAPLQPISSETVAPIAPTPTPATTSQPARNDARDEVRDQGSGASTQRTLGLVIGGVGLVGLAAGGYFGLQSNSKENEARDNCGNYPNDCSPAGISANDDAQTAAGYATIGFIAGGAALLGGIILYATAPNDPPASATLRLDPVVARSGGGLGLSGQW